MFKFFDDKKVAIYGIGTAYVLITQKNVSKSYAAAHDMLLSNGKYPGIIIGKPNCHLKSGKIINAMWNYCRTESTN
ncbi:MULTISPECIES: hypothetical protein [unclassified Legionella]|uniref:hypothetical protein n=1 Tax=unclassified Legionella TaxID=2622702 RepID=UPI0010566F9F|nr:MULTISPECIES: hypothetical protein [unclassified Legionella]MDI9819345.1 hypothetical protein [Legionella sp. PL877]